MEKVTFYSYKPYLSICLHRKRELFVTFSAECTYSPTNRTQLELLRQYAERTKGTYLISEIMAPEELGRRYREMEEKSIQEAEARKAAKVADERKRKEEHDFYSALRFSDRICR